MWRTAQLADTESLVAMSLRLYSEGPIVAIAPGVTRGNVRAQRLYESLGFAAVGTLI